MSQINQFILNKKRLKKPTVIAMREKQDWMATIWQKYRAIMMKK